MEVWDDEVVDMGQLFLGSEVLIDDVLEDVVPVLIGYQDLAVVDEHRDEHISLLLVSELQTALDHTAS